MDNIDKIIDKIIERVDALEIWTSDNPEVRRGENLYSMFLTYDEFLDLRELMKEVK